MKKAEIEAVEKQYREDHRGHGKDGKTPNYPDKIYRQVRKRPLLIVHLLKIDAEPNGREHPEPVVAWSISFPRTEMDEKRVEYVVNTTWLRENYRDDIEEDEMEGDDD